MNSDERWQRDSPAVALHEWVVRILYEANYPASPDFRGSPSWRLNLGDIYIPPLLVGAAALEEEI
jgi:hypothetical protein